jgi:hypothetical protein
MQFGQWRASRSQPGVAERFIETDTGFARHKVQDVEPLIDRAARVRNDLDGRTPDGGLYVGTIPVTVYHEWLKEWTIQGKIGPGHMDAVNDLILAKLRDSDFSKFRTTSRRV